MEETRPLGPAARTWALLTRPGPSWIAIESEPTDDRGVMWRHVAILAAIPAVCGLLGPLIFGFSLAGVRVRPSVVGHGLEAIAGYVLTFASVRIVAWWIALIAPAFGGVRDGGQALKIAAYSPTVWWAAGLLELWPSLGIPALILAGLYSLYTLSLGLAELMRIPEGRRLTCFAAVLVGVLIVAVVAGMLAAKAAELGGPLALA